MPQRPDRPPRNSDSNESNAPIEVLRPLDSSGHFVTLEAWEHALDRRVAIRMLDADAKQRQPLVDEFWRQARYQARIQHRSIVRVLSVDERAGWVVTEYIVASLSSNADAEGMPAEELQSRLIELLEGIEFLHNSGRVHGEIHPKILVIGEDGVAKLDRPCGREAIAELVRCEGLEQYAAPEMLDESAFGRVGPAADMYALGMCALELLAGDRLLEFFGTPEIDFQNQADAWLCWHMAEKSRIQPIANLIPNCPATLANVIERMLEKRVDRRLGSAREAIDALASGIVQGKTDEARPGSAIVPHVEQPIIQSFERPATSKALSSPIPATRLESKPKSLKGWVESLTDEKHSNQLAAAMVLLAAFVAGLAFVTSSSSKNQTIVAAAPESPRTAERQRPTYEPRSPESPTRETQTVASTSKTSEPPPPTETGCRVPTETPAPSPERGFLVLRVEPPEAMISMGTKRDRGNLTLAVKTGTYNIVASKWDCMSQRQTLQVASGETTSYTFRLKTKPTVDPYEPTLWVSHDGATDADKAIKRLLGDLWTPQARGGSLIPAERCVDTWFDQHEQADPRLAHALALATLNRPNGSERAERWFARAAHDAPVGYSWPFKEQIKCALSRGDVSEALRLADAFAYKAAVFIAANPEHPRITHFAVDTATFLGRVLGLAESLTVVADSTSLATQTIEARWDPQLRSILRDSKATAIARAQETIGRPIRADELLVSQFLGDTRSRQRQLLLASVGRRCPTKTPIQVSFDAPTPNTALRGVDMSAWPLASQALPSLLGL